MISWNFTFVNQAESCWKRYHPWIYSNYLETRHTDISDTANIHRDHIRCYCSYVPATRLQVTMSSIWAVLLSSRTHKSYTHARGVIEAVFHTLFLCHVSNMTCVVSSLEVGARLFTLFPASISYMWVMVWISSLFSRVCKFEIMSPQ